MKYITCLIGLSILLGCQSGGEIREKIILPGFEVLKGKHCESSGMLNALHYQGYNLTEEDIIGAGAILGFMFEKGEFPFLGGRSLSMKENCFQALDIPWEERIPEKGEDPWEEIAGLLKMDTPVVLRVDMRYLPYLYGGKYGPSYMSFGWHIICLAGIDFNRDLAYVTDTECEGIREIKLKDLKKARFSNTKVLPPRGIYYWAEKAPGDFHPSRETVCLKSLKLVASEMCGTYDQTESLAGMEGLEAFPLAMSNLDNQVPRYLLSPVLEFIYGSIETNGTGGAAFRQMYAAWVSRIARESGNSRIVQCSRLLKPVVVNWKNFAREIQNLAADKKSLKDKETRKSRLHDLSLLAGKIAESEKALYLYIQENL